MVVWINQNVDIPNKPHVKNCACFLLESIVKKLARVELEARLEHFVGDACRIQEYNGLLAHVVHGEENLWRVRTLQYLLGLVAHGHNACLERGRGGLLLGEQILNGLDDARVNGAAQASIRRHGYDQVLFDLGGLDFVHFDFGVELAESGAVRASHLQVLFGLGELGRADHLHGLGDLLDVFDRL